MANKIQLRRGVKANLPTLSVGEPAFTTDTKQLFIGDGNSNIEYAKKTDIPSTMKNPNALTINLNGTSQGAYDGSTAKSVNITPSGIGTYTKSEIDTKVSTINTQLNEKVQKTTKDITYYVNVTSGSDTNNGLASGTAFKTINKALSLIPQVINHNITIILANGFYDESVNLNFAGNGLFVISGDNVSSTNCRVTSLNASHCTCYVGVYGLYVVNNTINVFGCTDIKFNNMYLDKTSDNGFCIGSSNCIIANSQIWNKTNSAILVLHSQVYSSNNSGRDNNIGLKSAEGSTISKNGTQPEGTIAENTDGGGVIR